MKFDADNITSICTVIISVISLVTTIIFSRLQIKHNKNSVRPISAIKVSDYENDIAVKLENVGTGPLLIKRLRFKDRLRESSTLISMMPKIDQLWTTFTGAVDDWTIPVDGKLILLELIPESDAVKDIIRKKLANITVILQYEDIYGTKFYDQRKLDFFGRHVDNSDDI